MSTPAPPKKPLTILVAATEAAPLAKEGGLGDVAGSLPVALSALGCQCALVLPAYREILGKTPFTVAAREVPIWMGPDRLLVDILETSLAPGVPAYLVRHDPSFLRDGKYGDAYGPYGDNDQRFLLFSKAVAALPRHVPFVPDVILANDWQTGLVMALLDNGALPGTAGVFCIHNMGYLGLVPPEHVPLIGLPDRYLDWRGLEFWGRMSLMKAGIAFADKLVTVSPTYAREIRESWQGAGLEGLVQYRSDRLHGIVNGVDLALWNPATDPNLVANYSLEDRTGKTACKADLLERMGLSGEFMDQPVLGMVSRLVSQKGLDIFLVAAQGLMDLGLGIVVLGTGDQVYVEALRNLAQENPGRFAAKIAFDPALSRKIFAGADLFCVPSLYEPCGLTQLYAMAYGTLPLVRATGGLADTVSDPRHGHSPGTGFSFTPYWAGDLTWAASRAVDAWRDPPTWNAMTAQAMKSAQTFTWDRAARQYLKVFHQALAIRRGGA